MYVTINKNRKFNTLLNPVAYFFAYMNSACNPIIYALRSPAFRQGYKEILCWERATVFSDGHQGLRRGTLTADSKQNIPDAIRLEDIPADVLKLMTARSFSMPSKLTEAIHPGKTLTADTIPEESASVFQFLNSLRGSRSGSRNIRQGSIASIQSVTSNHSMNSRSLPKLSLPTMKGNSVIKKDGSVVIMKDGKIVCVRQDIGNKKSIDTHIFGDDKQNAASFTSGSLKRQNSSPVDMYEVDEAGSSWQNSMVDTNLAVDNAFDFSVIEEEESILDEIESAIVDDKVKVEVDSSSRNGLERLNSSGEENSQFTFSQRRNGSSGLIPQVDDLTEENKNSLNRNNLPDLSISLLGDSTPEVKTNNGHYRGQEKL
ncbi:unnamed protein product [Acanthosepion pharaonis]|uniref:Uncharacterized protein n=1 Tax=Acanthosepion pharaonis TaxID=158019 RepID=A0A812D0F9_ACAPH|nr:unnamed protein product [Sepia pharaonis]